MKTISLNGIWNLAGRDVTAIDSEKIKLKAEVPGCVQLDLSREGYLPSDLYRGENITETEKFEYYEWWYEKTFTAPEVKNNVHLVFEGVDCVAEYYLNGKKFGESDNMLISHEFRIDEFLEDGENTLLVHIKSPLACADGHDYTLKLINTQVCAEPKYVRKPTHSYGWDIMPRAVTSGIWREVRLEVRDEFYFSQDFVYSGEIYGETYNYFYYTIESDTVKTDGLELEISGSCGNDSSFYKRVDLKSKYARVRFDIENPKLWYPYGYGDANVYDGYARIWRGDTLVHEKAISFGLRSVKLERRLRTETDPGQFRILINGKEIMCKGSNWVPLDAFHSRDAQRYDAALALAKDIGCNILRCWGGNVYEDHKFFDFCDRNGIMVWQDFAMACAFFPESADFKEKFEREVTSVVRKLRSHPSLVLWAGDNEVDDVSRLNNTDMNTLSRQLIPQVIDKNDVGRPYLQSSPYITGAEYEAGIRSQVHGSPMVEDHLWGPRDYFKSDFYSQNKAHFVSETGYHGCPSLESIKKFITPESVWPYHKNPEWILHSSDQTGNDARLMLLEKQVKQLFGFIPTDPETFILASQISQAEADKYLIERMRVNRPDKTGIIWWNLLDGWPQISDAVVDYFFDKKLAYRYIKRSQAPFIIAAGELSNWHLPIYACNDTLKSVSGTLKVTDTSNDEILLETEFKIGENTSEKIAQIPLYYSDKKILVFEWETAEGCGRNHYLCGYPPVLLDDYKAAIEKYAL